MPGPGGAGATWEAALVDALWSADGVAVAVFRADGTYVAVNDALAAANGLPAADHAGRHLRDVAAPGVVDTLLAHVAAVVADGTARTGTEVVGPSTVWETAWLPLRDPDGTCVAVACLGLDVTAARRPALALHGGQARSVRWTQRLLAVTEALGGAGGPSVALADAFGRVAAALDAASAAVAPLDGDALVFRADLYGTTVVPSDLPARVRLDDPSSFSAAAAATGEPVWIGDLAGLRERFPLAASRLGTVPQTEGEQAWAAVPVRADGAVIGVLRLGWAAPQRFSAAQQAFLLATADQTGAVLHRLLLLESERAARQAAEAAGARARDLLRLAQGLAAARRVQDVARVFAASGYGGLGAVAGAIGLLDDEGRRIEILDVFGGPSWGHVDLDQVTPFAQALVSGRLQRATLAEVRARDPRAAQWMQDAGGRLSLAVPLRDERTVVGALGLHLSHADLAPDAVDHVEAVAALVGQALGRAVALEDALTTVEELQRAVLPQSIPSGPLVTVSAGYRASRRAREIGGDFYDVVTLPDGATLLLLGDVQGHDLAAAAIMGQLRAVMHSAAAEGEPPAEILSRADRFLATVERERFATAVAVELRPDAALAAVSVAGHIPPLLQVDGRVELLDLEPDLPLGMLDTRRAEHVLPMPADGRIVLVTDGVVERRDEGLGTSLDTLVASLPRLDDATPDEVVELLLSAAPDDTGDDAAVLVARIVLPTDTPRRLWRSLPPRTDSAHLARRWAEVGLRRHLGDEQAHEALVVLAELFTNAARAAARPVALTIAVDGACVRVGVRDDSHRRPRRREPTDTEADGRGLLIVEALSDRWWVEEHADGDKTVWAELSVS